MDILKKVMKVLASIFVIFVLIIIVASWYGSQREEQRQQRKAADQAVENTRDQALKAPYEAEANYINSHKYYFDVKGATLKSAHVQDFGEYDENGVVHVTEAWVDLDYQADVMGWPSLSEMEPWLARQLCSTSPDGKLTGLTVRYTLYAFDGNSTVYEPIDINSGNCN